MWGEGSLDRLLLSDPTGAFRHRNGCKDCPFSTHFHWEGMWISQWFFLCLPCLTLEYHPCLPITWCLCYLISTRLMNILGSIEQGSFVKFPGTSQEQNFPLSHVLLKRILPLPGGALDVHLPFLNRLRAFKSQVAKPAHFSYLYLSQAACHRSPGSS